MRKLIALLVTALMLSLLSIASPATAADGKCNGKHQLRGDTWQYQVRNATPTPIGGLRTSKFTLRATLEYYYCPNGIKPAKIKPVAVNWSWAQPKATDEHAFFERVIFDAYITNKFAQTSVPGAFTVLDDGTWFNGNRQIIPKHRRNWISMLGKPVWFVNYEIVNKGPVPNTSGPFENNTLGGFKNNILPKDRHTVILGPWIT